MKALLFAEEKHAKQLDDVGSPYIEHPKKVAEIIKLIYPNDNNLIDAAYLHDTLEDTDTTYEELVSVFCKDIADLVNEVTHEGNKDNIGYYFPRLKSQRGICLKFADRISNLSRMESWDEKRQEHYLRKSKFWNAGVMI